MTYEVDYIIKVANTGAAQAMRDMAAAVNLLGPSVNVLDRLNKRITKLNTLLNNKKWKLTLDTSQAESKITSLENRVAALRKSLAGMTGGSTRRGRALPRATAAPRQLFKSEGNYYARGGKPSAGLLGKGMQWSKTQIPLSAFTDKELSAYNSLLQKQATQQALYRKQLLAKYRSMAGWGPNTTFEQADKAWRQMLNTGMHKGGRGLSAREKKIYRTMNQLTATNSQMSRMTDGYVATYSGNNVPAGAPLKGARGGRGGRGGGGSRYAARPNNLGYKLFGPTPLTNNGGMAIDMLKGMGIAYGIAGLGSLAGNIISEATEYDNTMQTVENILKAHDKSSNFSSKFNSMSQTIRQVGLQTKFKATEVADAAKFLAMAGLGVTDINNAIKPISNVALIGDTDLGETADLVTNVMTGYNMKSHQLRRATDIMTNTFTMANVTLPEIAESYKYAGSPLQAAGIQFEEATAALGILGNAGLKGSQAGTTMRTILNNIINPRGKYRKEAWSNTGIEIFNEHGQLKELHTIFKELSNLDMPVDAFYKLFDKTAVQGAIALTENVDRWNEIIDENFLSQGIADDLAEKKKNTIQGLWYQLTSAITNDGINSFAGVHGQIKSLLQSVTTWVLSDSGQSAFTNVFNSLMEFMDIIKDVTQYFYRFYQTFGWAIKGMIKWQLYLWPIIKLITTLKTTFMALVGIGRVIASIHAITKAFIGLRAAVGGSAAIGIAARNAGAYMMSGGTVPLLPWLTGNVLATDANGNVAKGKGKSKRGKGASLTPGSIVYDKQTGTPLVVPGAGASAQSFKGWKWAQKMGKWGKGGVAAGMTLAGAGLGYGVDKAVGGEGGVGTTLGTIAGAGLGIWGMTGFAGAGALLSNPVGWGILAAAAIVGVTAAIVSSVKATREAERAAQKWGEGLKMLHSSAIDLTQDNGLMFANMRIFNSELDTQREKIQAGIDTLNEYWRLRNMGEDKPDSDASVASGTNGDKLNWLLNKADDNTGKYSQISPYLKQLNDYGYTYTEEVDNAGYTHYKVNGVEFGKSCWGNNYNETESVRAAAIIQGANASPQRMQAAFLHGLQTAKDARFLDENFAGVRKTWMPKTDEIHDNASRETMLGWSEQQFLKSKWYQIGWGKQVDDTEAMFNPLKNAMVAFSNGTAQSAEQLQDALYSAGLGILFDRNQFGVIGTPQWYQSIKNLQAHPENFRGLKGEALTAQAAHEEVGRTFDELVKFYTGFNNKWHPMFGDLLNRSIWSAALPAGETLNEGGFLPGNAVGAKAKANGVTYTWQQLTGNGNFGQYGWVDSEGHQYVPDSSMGTLQLYNAQNQPISGNGNYLNGITFNSAWATAYPIGKALQGVGAVPQKPDPLSFLQPRQYNPNYVWDFSLTPRQNIAASIGLYSGSYTFPSLIPQINQAGYQYQGAPLASQAQPNVTIQTDKPVAQGNQYLADNFVGSQNITLNYYEAQRLDTNILTGMLADAGRAGAGQMFGNQT